MPGISPPRKIRIFRPPSQDTVRPHVHVVATVFFLKDPPVSRHQHGDRVRQQEHSGSNGTGQPIGASVPDPRVFEIDGVHEVVQCHVGVVPTEARKKRGEQSGESNQRISSKRAEEQIEPHYIGLQLPYGAEQPNRARGIVERPAAHDGKASQLRLLRGDLVGQNRQAQKRIAA